MLSRRAVVCLRGSFPRTGIAASSILNPRARCCRARPGHVLFTSLSLTDVMEDLYTYINPHNGKHSPMISKETLDIVLANKDVSCGVCFTSELWH